MRLDSSSTVEGGLKRRYDHFRTKLGLSSNVLNDRMRVLVAEGADLDPVLLALMAWGDEHANEVPPVRLVHRTCGHPAAVMASRRP